MIKNWKLTLFHKRIYSAPRRENLEICNYLSIKIDIFNLEVHPARFGVQSARFGARRSIMPGSPSKMASGPSSAGIVSVKHYPNIFILYLVFVSWLFFWSISVSTMNHFFMIFSIPVYLWHYYLSTRWMLYLSAIYFSFEN